LSLFEKERTAFFYLVMAFRDKSPLIQSPAIGVDKGLSGVKSVDLPHPSFSCPDLLYLLKNHLPVSNVLTLKDRLHPCAYSSPVGLAL
jgi:hypothetical protein